MAEALRASFNSGSFEFEEWSEKVDEKEEDSWVHHHFRAQRIKNSICWIVCESKIDPSLCTLKKWEN